MKVCKECKYNKELSYFYLRKDTGKRRSICIECHNKKSAKYHKTNKNIILDKKIKYYANNKTEREKYRTKYYRENREAILVKKKKYYLEHKDEKLAYNKVYIRKREKSDINFKLANILRGRFGKALKNNTKSGSAVRDLGCSIQEFKQYLESKFYLNPETNEIMSWTNYGKKGWHIDHIKPLILFDLTDERQVKQACHYTNLQPMWAKQNLSKGKRIL